MNTKWLILSLMAIFMVGWQAAMAGDLNGKDLREHQRYEGWRRLVPTHLKVQYAGGMGVGSVGGGWDFGRKGQYETDLMLGVLPNAYAEDTHLILSLRQSFIPWSKSLNSRCAFEPLSCGIYATFITGEKFWFKEPSHYPGSYYKYSSRMRAYLYVGQRLTINSRADTRVRNITFYYELSINDLMLISKINNRSLRFSDVFTFSAGVKLQLFK